jgi:hypothetical protein
MVESSTEVIEGWNKCESVFKFGIEPGIEWQGGGFGGYEE